MPEEVPTWATAYECEGVGFSYNEPTIFIEYVIDAAREAHRKGKYTVFVTNGYATEEAVRAMKGYVDAVVVDYKGNGEELFQRRQTMTVSAEPVKQTLLELKGQGIHTELTDLIIPQVGENLEEAKKLCRWLYDNLGPDTPIQFTRFHPDYKLLNLPETRYDVLLRHYEAAQIAEFVGVPEFLSFFAVELYVIVGFQSFHDGIGILELSRLSYNTAGRGDQ